MLAKNVMHITRMRISLATLGAVGPAIGVILASYAGCNKSAVATLFTVGMGLMGFVYASLRVNSLDLSPNYSGTIMAIVNGLGSVSGMVAPILVGGLTPNRTLSEWRLVFWVMAIVIVGTNFLFVFWGSGEVQHWNDPPKMDTENGKNTKKECKGTEPLKEIYRNYTNEIDNSKK
uniref:Putative inorganic phosphate cotransporter n=1 Tax=Panstrongylus lignarius TaxID=156445 RepID=A0A224XZM7_9HEMI